MAATIKAFRGRESLRRLSRKRSDKEGKPKISPAAVVHEQLYEKLREAIIAGQLEHGSTLSVRGLAKDFGVSAMPAREAIRRLVAIGALELTGTRRVTIAHMTNEKLEEIKSARIALEPPLAARALQNVEGRTRAKKRLIDVLTKTDALLDRAIKRGDVDEYAKRNSDFHFTLYRAADTSVLLGLVESLWLQFGPFMRMVLGRIGTSSLDDRHKEAIEALRENDGKKLERAIRLDILEGMSNISAADFDRP